MTYSPVIEENSIALIQKRFGVSHDYAKRLAIAALDGIESHGGDPQDWNTVLETVNVVVSSWVEHGAFK